MKLTICDDEKKFANKIEKFCKKVLKEEKIKDVEIFYEPSGESFLNSVQETDILILDIEMDAVTGIEVKERLKKQNSEIKIIFLTSHVERMKEAFGKQVYGFVDKENYEELRAILLEVIKEAEKEKDYIIVDGEDGKKKLKLKDILYIKSNAVYLEFYTKNYKYLKRQKISECEVELERKGFYRVQNSYIINFEYMSSVNEKEVRIVGDIVLPIKRGTCKAVKIAYMNFLENKR